MDITTCAQLGRCRTRKNPTKHLAQQLVTQTGKVGPRKVVCLRLQDSQVTEPVSSLPPQCSLCYTMSPVQSPRLWETADQLAPDGNKTTELPHISDMANLDSAKNQGLESLQTIYRIGFVLEDSFSLELVFGGEFLNVTGLGGLPNTGCYKS